MKRKHIALLLCAALFVLLLPGAPAYAAEKMTFISINDTLPPELDNCVAIYGGQTYVPYFVFSNYGLGISYSYFTSASTAYLFTKEKQLFFELNSGDTYDGVDNHYAVSAILRGGTVYLPVNLVYRFFGGFTYSSIEGNEYGSILRIKTDAVVLSDADFLRAARSTMRSRWMAYNNESGTVTETPPPSATPSPPETHEGERVTLSFTGVPTDRVLTLLEQYGVTACFFLTAEDVLENPDMVRRAVGEGHSAGVYCAGAEPAADYERTAALLFEAARVRAILTAAPSETAEAARAMAEEQGLVFCPSDFGDEADGYSVTAYTVTAWLETAVERTSLRVGCAQGSQTLGPILQYLSTQRYDVVCPRETDAL